ncbi:MAG: hypothetical protein QOD09_1625 [Bradyrhizobium sp.]|nr:hypothetical protein [Bradyrhizobium sp.]
MRRLRLCLASMASGALGNRPSPLRGSAFNGWTGLEREGESLRDHGASLSSSRKNRFQGRRSRRDGASERRFLYYQGASIGAPSPLKKGRSTKTSNSRGGARTRARGCLKCESEDFSQGADTRTASSRRRPGPIPPCVVVLALGARPFATRDARGYGSRPSPGRRKNKTAHLSVGGLCEQSSRYDCGASLGGVGRGRCWAMKASNSSLSLA